MKNTLFVVCPFSCMELYLQRNYLNTAFFLTCPGAIVPYWDVEFMEAVDELILREKVQEICFVNDTSCRLINAIVRKDKLHGMPAETILEELYISGYTNNFQNQSIDYQIFKLAELNVTMQIDNLRESSILGSTILTKNIEIKGLVTSKTKNQLKEILKTNTQIYEF